MVVWHYWLRVLRRATKEAGELAGLHQPARHVFAAIALLAFVGIAVGFGANAVVESKLIAALIAAGAVVGVFLLTVFWKLIAIPAKLDNELRPQLDRAAISELREVFDEGQKLNIQSQHLDKESAPLWVVRLIQWDHRARATVERHFSEGESFMFATVAQIGPIDDEVIIHNLRGYQSALSARLNKLRFMMGRVLPGLSTRPNQD